MSERFEREMVQTVIEVAESKGLNHAQLARRAYGETESAVVKWRKQRREDSPQSVSISNAFCLANAAGLDLPDLLFRVQAKIKMES